MCSNKLKYYFSDTEFIRNRPNPIYTWAFMTGSKSKYSNVFRKVTAIMRKGSPQSDWVSGSVWGSPIAILLQVVGVYQWMKR